MKARKKAKKNQEGTKRKSPKEKRKENYKSDRTGKSLERGSG